MSMETETKTTEAKPEEKGMFILEDGRNMVVTFALVSCLFLLWGLLNGMIDSMDKHFKDALHLSLAQCANVQWAHYLGYFLMALPAGWLATKFGYKGGIIAGLSMVAIGGFWFTIATSFWACLAGVCFIAAGLAFLETIANPYTTVLGPTKYAANRINLAQSTNGIGWICGPIAGAYFFYSKNAAGESTGSQLMWIPYFCLAIGALGLVVAFYFADVPDIKTEDDYHLDESDPTVTHSIWAHPHFVMAVAAQFFYVAAQAGIFAYFIYYMTNETPAVDSFKSSLRDSWTELGKDGKLHFSDQFGSLLQSIGGFGLFLLGRFTGTMILKKVHAHTLLGVYGLVSIVLCALIVAHLGWLSVACVFLSFFFMSIMFPTIFALGIFGLGVRAKSASAFIVLAIMGGATLPKLMGYIGDKEGMSMGFVVPMVAFGVVAFYGLFWPKLSGVPSMQSQVSMAGH